jgi:MFS family permease
MAKSPIRQLLGERNPALLLFGQTLSGFGDGVANVALTLLVIDTTHSASKLGWFAAARMIPLVAFILVGGVIVDRLPRRLLLLASDLGRAALTFGLVALLITHHCTFSALLAFGFFFGMFDAVFMPAFTAFIPEITPEALLPAMNGVRPITTNLIGQMLGPAVGGIMAAWSTTWAIGLDAATFVVSATTLALIRVATIAKREATTSMLHEIREGAAYVKRTTWIWATLLSITLLNALVFSPMMVLFPFYMRHDLHLHPTYVGYTFALFGASGALGGLWAAQRAVPRRRIRTMWCYWTIGGLSPLLLLAAHQYWPIALIVVIDGLTMVGGNVIWESMMQSEVPRELLGRVSSVDWFFSLGLTPVGLVVAGSLGSRMGIVPYFVTMSLVTVAPGLLVLLSKRVNAVDAGRRAA